MLSSVTPLHTTQTQTHKHTCTYMHTQTHTHAHTCTHICTHKHTHKHTCTHICTYKHTQTHMHIHMHTHVHTQTHMQTNHVHSHTHSHLHELRDATLLEIARKRHCSWHVLRAKTNAHKHKMSAGHYQQSKKKAVQSWCDATAEAWHFMRSMSCALACEFSRLGVVLRGKCCHRGISACLKLQTCHHSCMPALSMDLYKLHTVRVWAWTQPTCTHQSTRQSISWDPRSFLGSSLPIIFSFVLFDQLFYLEVQL